MTDVPFHETRRGVTFYERDVPRLVEALQRIATELETLTSLLQKTEDGDGPGAPEE